MPAQAAPRPARLSDEVREGTAVRTGLESRAEARERLVGESELGAGFEAGADRGPLAHLIAQPRRSWCSLRRHELHILDHLADARFFKLRRVRDCQEKAEEQQEEVAMPPLHA